MTFCIDGPDGRHNGYAGYLDGNATLLQGTASAVIVQSYLPEDEPATQGNAWGPVERVDPQDEDDEFPVSITLRSGAPSELESGHRCGEPSIVRFELVDPTPDVIATFDWEATFVVKHLDYDPDPEDLSIEIVDLR